MALGVGAQTRGGRALDWGGGGVKYSPLARPPAPKRAQSHPRESLPQGTQITALVVRFWTGSGGQ